MKAVVAAFIQEKAQVGAFSVIVQLCRIIVNSSSVASALCPGSYIAAQFTRNFVTNCIKASTSQTVSLWAWPALPSSTLHPLASTLFMPQLHRTLQPPSICRDKWLYTLTYCQNNSCLNACYNKYWISIRVVGWGPYHFPLKIIKMDAFDGTVVIIF